MRALAVMLACFIGLTPRPSRACDYAPLAPHQTDPTEAALDTKPPSAITKTSFTLQRGHGPEGGCLSESSDSCADIGTLTLHFEPASDDRTDAANMGYRIEVVAGHAPSDPTWPSSAVRAFDGSSLYLHWVDGEDDEQEALDFTLSISAVDRAGNQGPATQVRVRHAGSSEGCRVTGSSVNLAWWLLAFALASARARRRPSSRRRRDARCAPATE